MREVTAFQYKCEERLTQAIVAYEEKLVDRRFEGGGA